MQRTDDHCMMDAANTRFVAGGIKFEIPRAVFFVPASSSRDDLVKIPSRSVGHDLGLHDPIGNGTGLRRNCPVGFLEDWSFPVPSEFRGRGSVPWFRTRPCS